MMKYRYSAVIPCFNVGIACVPVIRAAAAQVESTIVVDDGSTDDTHTQLKAITLPKLTVLRHESNRGKGAALISGFRHALDQTDCDAILTVDSDGQHDPALIPSFLNLYEAEQTALIYGNRMVTMSGMPHHRRWLNALSNKIVSSICKQRIYDSQCGFRLYSRTLLNAVMEQARSCRYELETEILILGCKRGFRVASVPISMIYSKQTTELSHHSLADVLRITRLMWKHW